MLKTILQTILNSILPMISGNIIGSKKKLIDENKNKKIPSGDIPYGKPDSGMTEDYLEKEVDIVVDKKVRTKYKKGWIKKVRKKPIIEIVIHGTAGGRSVAGLLHWMYNWGRRGYLKGVGLFHYAIGRGDKGEEDGLIIEVIDPEYYVYHSTSGNNDKTSIGIELLNTSKSNRDPYTDAQYESLFRLIFDYLMKIYPTITRITGHRYNIWRWNRNSIAKKYDKNCPGNFYWNKLESELKKRGYSYKVDGTMLHYNIRKV